MSSDDIRDRLLQTLRAQLRILEETHTLTYLDSVRLVASLLDQVMGEARAAGELPDTAAHQQPPLSVVSEELTPSSIAAARAAAAAKEPPPPEPPPSSGTVLQYFAVGKPTPDIDPFAVARAQQQQASTSSATITAAFPFDDEDAGPEEMEAIDISLLGAELIPTPEPTGDPQLDQQPVRRHPRFVSRTEVLIATESRDELEQLWTRDISRGGLFVHTDDPPPAGTPLRVVLQTPDGSLELHGQVAHMLDDATASAAGTAPGAGVQFVQMSDEQRGALERYLQGMAEHLSQEVEREAKEQDDEAIGAALRIVMYVQSSALYEAIELPPEASTEKIKARLDQLAQEMSRAATSVEADQRPRVDEAVSALEQLASTLVNPLRRLAYDFTNDHVRAAARLEEYRVAGKAPDELRAVWHKVFPDQLSEAQEKIALALDHARKRDFTVAIQQGRVALQLDPFNLRLRDAITRWERASQAPAQ